MVAEANWTILSTECPYCGDEVVGTVGVLHHDPPKTGDYTICPCCFGIAAFEPDLSMRRLTNAERAAASMNRPLQATLAHLRRITG